MHNVTVSPDILELDPVFDERYLGELEDDDEDIA